MNKPAKHLGPLDKRWWTRPRILCIALLLLVAGYIYAQPTLERWLGMELPTLVERPNDQPAPADSGGNPGDTDRYPLEKIAGDTWKSPEGLVYGPGAGEHRIAHVMRHAASDNSRKPVHGVFDADSQDEVLRLLDEAYRLAKQNSGKVRRKQVDRKTELTIEMPQQIGYVGGRDGKKENYPRTNRMKLVLEDDRVITAYPTWPRK